MTPWFSATVAAPGMIAEWGIDQGSTSWLTIAVQLGFVIGTCLSAGLMLSDRFSPRRLAAVSSVIAAIATLLLIRRGTDAKEAILLRGLAGMALAGVYPPGIKIAAGWWRERRGTAIGILVGALTIGSAAPNLFRLAVDASHWRSIVVAAAVGAAASAARFALPPRHSTHARWWPSFGIEGSCWPQVATLDTCGSCTPCGARSVAFGHMSPPRVPSRRPWQRGCHS